MKKHTALTVALVALLAAVTLRFFGLPGARHGVPIHMERVSVVVPITFRQDHRVVLGTEPIRADVLQERLRQEMETTPQREVFLRGERGVEIGDVTQVIDALRAAGVEHIALVSN